MFWSSIRGVFKQEGHFRSDFRQIYLAYCLKTSVYEHIKLCSSILDGLNACSYLQNTVIWMRFGSVCLQACFPRHSGEASRLLLLSYKSLSSFLSGAVEPVGHRVGFRHVCLPLCLVNAFLFWQTKLHVNVLLGEADAFLIKTPVVFILCSFYQVLWAQSYRPVSMTCIGNNIIAKLNKDVNGNLCTVLAHVFLLLFNFQPHHLNTVTCQSQQAPVHTHIEILQNIYCANRCQKPGWIY